MAPLYIGLGALAAYFLTKPSSVNVTVNTPPSGGTVQSTDGKTTSDIALLDTPHAELIQNMNPAPTSNPGPNPATVPYGAPGNAATPATGPTLAPRPTIQAPPSVVSAPVAAITSRAPAAPPKSYAPVERPWTPPTPSSVFGAQWNGGNLDDRDAWANWQSRQNTSVVDYQSPGGA